VAVTFDLFGTLVRADRPDDPASAVARELRKRDVPVPDDWDAAYRERHVDAPEGAEVPLPAHVSQALLSRGIDPASRGDSEAGKAVRRAVVAASDPTVETREGAVAAVEAAAEAGPVGVLSNCSVPDLARRALLRSAVDRDGMDAVVTSAGCGWRKPDRRAFEAAARRLAVDPGALVHVGDDPRTDAGVGAVGGTAVIVGDESSKNVDDRSADGMDDWSATDVKVDATVPLTSFPDWLDE